MPKHALDVIAWRPCERNTLKGFASVQMTIHDVALHEKNGKHWAQPPSKPMVQDGQLIYGSDGRVRYVLVLELDDRETASAFAGQPSRLSRIRKKPRSWWTPTRGLLFVTAINHGG
jgi:hypothetical protein